MKLIQKLALCAALVLAGSTFGSTLYWQVDPLSVSGQPGAYTGTIGSAAGQANYAVLKAVQNSTVASGGSVVAAYDLTEGTAWATELGSTYGSSTYSFYVELLNNSGTSIWTQQVATSYGNLVSSGYVSTSALSVNPAVVGGGMNGAAAPEPTSGLLLLLGGAMLALRRRRA